MPVTRCDGSEGEIETGDRYREVCCPSGALPGHSPVWARAARGSRQYPFMSWSGSRHMFGRMFASDDQDKLRLTEIVALEPIDSHTHIALTTPEFVAMQQRLHVRVLDLLFVNDRQPYRATLSPQNQDALNFVTSSMGHAPIVHDIRSNFGPK